MTLRMERRDTRISGPRTHSACDGPGAVPLLLYARPSLGPQPRALWSAARISAAAPRAPAGSHSVTNMQRSKSFVSGSDGSHRSCRYVIVCCRMPTGAGPGPRHCQPESRRLPPLSRPSQSMPVTSGASGPPEPNSRSKPSPSKVPSNLRSTSKSAPQPSGPPPPGGPPAPTPASTSASRIDRLSSQTLPEPVAVAVPPPTPKPNSVTWDCMLRPNDLTSISSVTVSNSISREPLLGPMYGASGPSISLTESPISSSSFSTGSHHLLAPLFLQPSSFASPSSMLV
mmetsp:Transcript_23540/g.67447  ORF Transcript_23540/g.67447 Transcript_23540/m.67447 type:complete len:285 (-) Transcript_23540:490-1344(-)